MLGLQLLQGSTASLYCDKWGTAGVTQTQRQDVQEMLDLLFVTKINARAALSLTKYVSKYMSDKIYIQIYVRAYAAVVENSMRKGRLPRWNESLVRCHDNLCNPSEFRGFDQRRNDMCFSHLAVHLASVRDHRLAHSLAALLCRRPRPHGDA